MSDVLFISYLNFNTVFKMPFSINENDLIILF